MGDREVGLKAKGLGIEHMLHFGCPRTEVIETSIKNIDEQLVENNRQIEECVNSLLEMTNGLSEDSGKSFYHPVDALNYMCDARLLDSSSCYDPEPEDITKLLRHVISVLDKNPGCEESVLSQLLVLSAEEGICFPFRSSMLDQGARSTLSINTAEDKQEQINDSLWNDISLRLRKYFIGKLQKLPVKELSSHIGLITEKRLRYVQSLCSLYKASEVWSRYRSIRFVQLEQLMFSGQSKDKNPQFKKCVLFYEANNQYIIEMMNQDFELLNSGVFGDAISTIDAIQDIYSDKLLDDFSVVTDILQQEMTNTVSSRKRSDNSKDNGNKSDLPKSSSEFGFKGAFRGNLRRKASKSLDSLLPQAEDNFTDLQVLPMQYVEQLVRFVACVTAIEDHIDTLRDTLIWQTGGANAPFSAIKPRRLKSALKRSQNLDLNNKLFKGVFENSGMLEEAIPPVFGATQAMVAEVSSSLRVVEKVVEETPRWNWQGSLHKLAPEFAQCVEIYVKSATEHILKGELDNIEGMDMALVPGELVGGRLDYPRMVSKNTLQLVEVLDKVLPLAQATGKDGPLHVIRSAFVDSTVLSFKNISMRYSQICREQVLTSQTKQHVLSCVAFLRNHLLYYENALSLENTENKSLSSLYKQYCELVDTLCKSTMDHHINHINTCILLDAESQHWDDTKEFYEDERCSFTIQMWSYYLRTLQDDLWSVCPPKLSQTMYTNVLQESLSTLAMRYAHIKPGYRRVNQFRCDVCTILLCVSELLYPACTSVSRYLDPCTQHKEHYSIHNSCNTLLSALAVVASPLDTLARVYKKGFKKKRCKSEDGSKGHVSQWLSVIRPDLYLHGQLGYNDLQTTNALFVHLNLMTLQPSLPYNILLQAILMKDYTLPIMLLTQAASHYSPPEIGDPDIDQRSSNGRQRSRDSDRQMTKTPDDQVLDKVFGAFVDILMKCGSTFPDALTKVMLPIIERSQSWELLDNKMVLGKGEEIPPWFQALIGCLNMFIQRVMEPGIAVLLKKEESHVEIDPLVKLMNELPCGCIPQSDTEDYVQDKGDETIEHNFTSNKKGSKDPLAEALFSMITQMSEEIHTLPSPIVIMFKAIQDQLGQKGVNTPHNCVAIKFLATALRENLLNVSVVETLTGEPMNNEKKDKLKMLAECSYHALTATSYGKGSGTPRIAGLFMKANRNWLSEQVDTMVEHFNSELFEMPDPSTLSSQTPDFTENQLSLLASSMLSSKAGSDSLHTAYNLITHNKPWITSQLDIPPLLPTPESGHNNNGDKQFVLCLDAVQRETVNPLDVFDSIGEYKFDMTAINEMEIPWAKILQSDLGLTEIGFKALLYNRHQMQDDAFLEESEMKPVSVLRAKFENGGGTQ